MSRPPSVRSLRVGCAMWAHKAWVGRFFPAGTKPGDELAAYATWCTDVEGNTTFYAQPKATTVARWAELAPADFRFCFKLPREITHDRRLRNSADLVVGFIARLEPLIDRLGPLLIQLPASFGPDGIDTLGAFLAELPSELAYAVEVRHPAFFAGGDAEAPLDQLLAGAGIDRVILDSRALFATAPQTPEEHDAWRNKPRLPVRPHATGSQPIIRLIGERNIDRSLAVWRRWIPRLVSWIEEGRTPFVFTHTPDNVVAPELARRFWADVSASVDSLMPLPVPQRMTSQLDLWATETTAGPTD